MNNFQIRNLSPVGKLFAGIFTTLMLCVTLWIAFIYYVEEGMIPDGTLPLYLQNEARQDAEDILTEDSLAVRSPVWDSTTAGMEQYFDTTQLAESLIKYIYEKENHRTDFEKMHDKLRDNVGLAHTHINGQTLLFFALGLVFIFTSTPDKIKKISLWLFGVAVLFHAIGLSGKGFYCIYNDILTVSGLLLIACILYMAYRIYIDLGKAPLKDKE